MEFEDNWASIFVRVARDAAYEMFKASALRNMAGEELLAALRAVSQQKEATPMEIIRSLS